MTPRILTHRRRTYHATSNALATNSAVAAPVCPLGKLEVGGDESRRFTSGRCREIVSCTQRKTSACADTASTRKIDSRHRLSTSRITMATTMSAPTIAPVLPSPEKT